jgi:hypothetical protein
MSQEFYSEDDHDEMVDNFRAEVLRYAQSVAEHFPGDFEQVAQHLESEYPELLTTDMIEEIAEEVVGHRPSAFYELVTQAPV